MGHIIGAEWLWLRRMGQPVPDVEVWPTVPLGECTSRLDGLTRTWRGYVTGLMPELLGREIAYTNSKGERWSNQVADVLTHVILHSSYHRGQIASLLGRAEEPAAYSDYIELVRRGHSAAGWPT